MTADDLPEPLSPTDEGAIRTLVAASQRHQSDTSALTMLHTPDAIVVNAPGRRVLGRDALVAAMDAALATPLRQVRTSLEIEDIRPVTTGVALVSCVKTIHDERPAADGTAALPATGALTYVVTRQADTWRIALAQTTPRL